MSRGLLGKKLGMTAFFSPEGQLVPVTVVEAGRHRFTVAIVPQTRRLTTLGQVRAGAKVNLEFDLVAKYLRRLSELGRVTGDASSQWQEEYGGGR